MKKITFNIHGGLKKKDELKNKINQRLSDQFEIQYFQTGASGDGIHLARIAVEGQTDYLISVGGDGMLNEVINGYMNVVNKVNKPIVGLLPYGTGNDFSKTVGIRKDIEQLAQLIENNCNKPVDIGEIKYRLETGETKTRYFINITDLGIGGHVVKIVNQSSKFLGPNLTYKKAIIQSFFSYKYKKIRLTSDSFQWEGPILSLCMANGRYFGSGMCIAPQADVSDGLIQLVIFGNISLLDYLKNIPKVKKGELLLHPEVYYEQVRSCRIEPLDGDCPVDMDGEFIGYAPIELKVHKGALRFLME